MVKTRIQFKSHKQSLGITNMFETNISETKLFFFFRRLAYLKLKQMQGKEVFEASPHQLGGRERERDA